MANHDRIADALERIATALERTADADPLTVLSQMIGDDVTPITEPQAPYAGNGQTYMYQHPGQDGVYQIVARRDGTAEGGYRVSVEEA